MSDYDLCYFCDGTGDDGDWYCRVCKGEGVAERWVMEAESMVVGWSECFANADEFYGRLDEEPAPARVSGDFGLTGGLPGEEEE